MKEWLDNETLLILIIGLVITLGMLIAYSIWRPKIKWSNKRDRYCLYWENIKHYEEYGSSDKYELEINSIDLPKFLNWFRYDKNN